MPELPEVETVVRILSTQILNQTIQDITVKWDKTVENKALFVNEVKGQTIRTITRRGKYICLHLDRGNILIHLRMEGKFFIREKNELPFKHTHVILHLNDMNLEFNDTRKFGRMMYTEDAEGYLNTKLGLEPFDSALTVEYLQNKAKSRTIALKTFLLDQSVIAGIGNIYSDEICFKMLRNPQQSVTKLTKKDWANCIQFTRSILQAAIDAGGTSVRSYTSSLGVTGLFQLNIDVYGRANQPCHNCQTPLVRVVINQRSSVYCPNCQKR
jgi:formamidopyrimidine-DNA glycosylase